VPLRGNTVHGNASMGPRLFSRGKAVVVQAGTTNSDASMGPRLFSRGKQRRRRVHDAFRRASMGPRLFSRGKGTGHVRFAWYGALQWGRGCSAAESG